MLQIMGFTEHFVFLQKVWFHYGFNHSFYTFGTTKKSYLLWLYLPCLQIELKLKKVEGIMWKNLEGEEELEPKVAANPAGTYIHIVINISSFSPVTFLASTVIFFMQNLCYYFRFFICPCPLVPPRPWENDVEHIVSSLSLWMLICIRYGVHILLV